MRHEYLDGLAPARKPKHPVETADLEGVPKNGWGKSKTRVRLKIIYARRKKLVAYLLARRFIHPQTGCWEYMSARTEKGYGRFVVSHHRNPFNVRVPRLSATLFLGFNMGRKQVLHRCDNPPCFNPDHLYIGTNSDNLQDSFSRGKRIRPR